MDIACYGNNTNCNMDQNCMLNKKANVFGLTEIIGSIVGWIWNYWHYTAFAIPAWGFGARETFDIIIFGVPLADWIFYPITGGVFVTVVMFDPILWLWKKIPERFKFVLPIVRHGWLMQYKGVLRGTTASLFCSALAKYIIYITLVWLTLFGIFVFGKSGTMTACFFGIPSIVMLFLIWKEWRVCHFLRVGIVVVLTNVIWDIIACNTWIVPILNWKIDIQWYYNKNVGYFSELDCFWFKNVPMEMTPYLGLMGWPYIYGMILILNKHIKGKSIFVK